MEGKKRKKLCITTIVVCVAITAFVLLRYNDGDYGTETVWYDGPEPPITTVTLEKDGVFYDVEAVEGQVIVLFNNDISHKKAVNILKRNKSRIISQVPNIHFYEVLVETGTENLFITKMKDLPDVSFVYPATILYQNTVIPHVIDDFTFSNHGAMVMEMMKGCFPLMNVITHDVGNDSNSVCSLCVEMGVKIRRLHRIFIKTLIASIPGHELFDDYHLINSHVINLSFGPGLAKEKRKILYDDEIVTNEMRTSFFHRYVDHIIFFVKIFEAFDYDHYDYVITLSAGNEGMKDMEKIYSAIRKELSEEELEIFDRHFIIVSAKDNNKERDYPNDVSNGNYHFMQTKVDISDMTAKDLRWQGTSFSAPRASGFIAAVADEYKIDVVDVLRFVREVTEEHPQHLLTFEDLSAKVAGHNGYVDLGLPSKTLWKNKNEDGYYDYFEACNRYDDNNLPNIEQLEELRTHCTWTWGYFGYLVTGPNGHSIVLPTFINHEGNYADRGDDQVLCSLSTDDEYGENILCLEYDKYSRYIVSKNRHDRMQVRLVKNNVQKNVISKDAPPPQNKNFPFDYYGIIPYNENMFNNGSSGVMTLSNGERVHYKFERDLIYSIDFFLDGEDISKKYKLAGLETLDAEQGFVGENKTYTQQITLNFCFNYYSIKSPKLYIIVKKKS